MFGRDSESTDHGMLGRDSAALVWLQSALVEMKARESLADLIRWHRAKKAAVERRHSKWGPFWKMLDRWCQATTGTINMMVIKIGQGAKAIWRAFLAVLAGIWCVVVALWVLGKSLKSGVCHYYYFDHTPTVPPAAPPASAAPKQAPKR